jgi:hypothetical protein
MKYLLSGLVLVLICLVVSCEDDSDSAAPADFTSRANWTAFDAGVTAGRDTRGYFGVVADGRYVYYVPTFSLGFLGAMLRYDTRQAFDAAESWASYDTRSAVQFADGYAGGAVEGGYVYLAPFVSGQGRHARVLRLDSQSGFTTPSSWSSYDASPHTGGALGYNGAVSDGRYVYFTPYGYPPAAHGVVLRLDTRGDFQAATSWAAYNAGATGGLYTQGYYGQAFDGRYIYFAPFNDGQAFHGRVLRYDTQASFTDAASWRAYDAGVTGGFMTVGYKGAVCAGRYVYFVPYRDDVDAHGRVLRLDTAGDFGDPSSWTTYDAGSTDGLDTRGYVEAAFDGRHIYFCPYKLGDGAFQGRFLRYDSRGDFHAASSWSAFHPGTLNGLAIRGYKGVVYDGTHLYFAPYHDGAGYSGTVLRYRP